MNEKLPHSPQFYLPINVSTSYEHHSQTNQYMPHGKYMKNTPDSLAPDEVLAKSVENMP